MDLLLPLYRFLRVALPYWIGPLIAAVIIIALAQSGISLSPYWALIITVVIIALIMSSLIAFNRYREIERLEDDIEITLLQHGATDADLIQTEEDEEKEVTHVHRHRIRRR